MSIFNVINTYSAVNVHGLMNAVKYSLVVAPVQIIGVILLSYAFNQGYKYFSDRLWVTPTIVAVASTTMQVIIGLLMVHQVPHKGEIIGIILCLLGALIAVFWK